MVGLVGRAGFLATPDLLLYGVGGVEFGHFVYPRGRDAIGGNNGKWAPGYTAGAGAELRMTDHWSLRGEYRYLHFDVDRNETIGSAGVEAVSGDASEATTNTARQTAADFHIGKIGVVYKFGGGGPASAMAAMPSSLASTWTDGWAGPYFGAYFGAGAGVARGDFAAISTSSSGTFPQNAALAGTMTGMQTDLFAGYSLRSDRFVVGGQVEATQYGDVAVKMAGTQTTLLPPTSVQTSTLDQSERLRSMVSVVGRAGFLATPNLLLYGLGGLALGHFKYPDQGDRFPDPVGKWVAGYTVGAGGELKVARHWSLRTEYRYLHFDIERGASYDIFPTAGGSTAVSFASRTRTDFHLGKVGLVYRIGEDSPSAMAALPGSAEACCDRWTGFSAGIYGAGGAGRVRDAITSSSDNRTLLPPPVIISGSNDFQSGELAGDISGGMIDLFAGYNWRAGQFVIGGQAEATIFGDVGMKSRGTLVGTSTSLVPPSDDGSHHRPIRIRAVAAVAGGPDRPCRLAGDAEPAALRARWRRVRAFHFPGHRGPGWRRLWQMGVRLYSRRRRRVEADRPLVGARRISLHAFQSRPQGRQRLDVHGCRICYSQREQQHGSNPHGSPSRQGRRRLHVLLLRLTGSRLSGDLTGWPDCC